MNKRLGIDVGGSGIKGAIINDETGELLTERVRIPTPQPATPEAVTDVIAEVVQELGWKDKPFGCGFPAAIQHGVVRTASNIDNSWIGVNGEELISQKTGCEVKLLNDADAAGVAEMRWGAGKEAHEGVVILITVGTGLGTAVFTNGHLLPNTELGHLPMRGLPAEHLAADSAKEQLSLNWKTWRANFHDYLALMEQFFWPDLFIIGGGISKKPKRFMADYAGRAKMIPAQMKNEAGIAGAAMAIELPAEGE
jgi:polyphosphate glucokinase